MSLRFNFPIEVDAATWQTFPFAMMAVGMGRVTEQNAKEVAWRISLFEKLHGSFRKTTDKFHQADHPYTLAEIRTLIGFTCNVSNESEAKFRKRILDSAQQEFNYANRG
jgi:hypothetical protein